MAASDARRMDVTITQEDMTRFAGMLGYRHAGFSRTVHNHHTDPELARAIGLPGTVAQALHYCAYIAQLMLEQHGGDWLTAGNLDMTFLEPVYPGDHLVISVDDAAGAVEVRNQRDELVAIGNARAGAAR